MTIANVLDLSTAHVKPAGKDRFGDLPPKTATLFRKLAQEFVKAQAPVIETALVADRRRVPKRR